MVKRTALIIMIAVLAFAAAGVGCVYIARGLSLGGSAAVNALRSTQGAGYSASGSAVSVTY